MYNEKYKDFKMKTKNHLVQDITTGELYNNSDTDIASRNPERSYPKELWIKSLFVYQNTMRDIPVKDKGHVFEWISYGLDQENTLSDKYLEKLKKEYDPKTVQTLLKRLVDSKTTARVKRGKYVLNPKIMFFGSNGVSKKTEALFK